jgi:nicotinate-nucleotide adenylyltransferase
MNNLSCDSREIERGGKSYMVETLAALRSELSTEPLLLFIGMDAFSGIERWHCWQQLFDYAHLVVMTRPQCAKPVLHDFLAARESRQIAALKNICAGRLFFQAVTQLDICATEIRALQAQKRSLRFLLPDNVIDYIQQQQLYQKL